MSKFLSASILAAFSALILFNGCSTDIEVIAPERDLTVIYGLLEANNTRHYIRINRAFSGEDSASVMAATPGINEYSSDELSARIIELDENKTPTGNEWPLMETYVYEKADGAFFSDSNKVYFFDAQLNASRLYKIECIVTLKDQEPKTVSATTGLISPQGGTTSVILTSPKVTQSGDRNPDEVTLVSNKYAQEFKVVWSRANNGFRYTTFARFYYRDIYPDGRILLDSVQLPIGSKEFENDADIQFFINAEEWYRTIGDNVSDHDTSNKEFVRVASDTLQFFVQIADDELNTYIRINQPVTGVLQDRPEYTNVDNGIGIFASRISSSTRLKNDPLKNGRILDKLSTQELLFSDSELTKYYTRSKGFKVPGRCSYNFDLGTWFCK